MGSVSADPPIRDAATVILVRRGGGAPRVLMGQRGAGASFMPSLFVFPGGAVDPSDSAIPGFQGLIPKEAARHGAGAGALAACAIRELWEETGLRLGTPGAFQGWAGFGATGLAPCARPLRTVFRAITPPGRPRRFDARFFLADAAEIADDLDDFSAADAELSHLTWLTLEEADALPTPFVTKVVLAEIAARLEHPEADLPVPFVDNRGAIATLTALEPA